MKALLTIATLVFTMNASATQITACTANEVSASAYLDMVYQDMKNDTTELNDLQKAIESQLPSNNLYNGNVSSIEALFTEGGWVVVLGFDITNMIATVFVEQDCMSGRPVYTTDENGQLKVKVKM